MARSIPNTTNTSNIPNFAGGSGAASDGDKGDITVASSGASFTIDNDTVTFAKMQNIATDSLIGRDTAGTGDPENITLNTTLSMTGTGALQRAALTGDVTASAGSNATTIANDAVTFAKMQNIATDSLIGRDTASSGDPENITLGSSLQMSGSGALQRAALTGDVTASADSNATTIANDAVTFAKMQNIATSTIIGRSTSGTGDPESLTVGGALSISGGVLSDGWTYVILGNDVNNATINAADVGLAFTPAANKLYEITCWLIHNTSSATTGFQWSFVDGSGATYSSQHINAPNGPASTILTIGPMNTFGNETNSVASQNMIAIGNAVVKASANPSGTVKVQFKSEVAGGESVNVLAGSFLRYRILA